MRYTRVGDVDSAVSKRCTDWIPEVQKSSKSVDSVSEMLIVS